MKKIFLSFIALFFFGLLCNAQDYQVYSVKGEIKCNDGQNEVIATVGMFISSTTIVSIPEGGRIVVFDEANKKLHTIKTASSGLILELLKKDDVSVQELTDSYLTYVKSKMDESNNLKDKNYRQSAGTAYRDPDSLLMQSLFPDDTLNNPNNK